MLATTSLESAGYIAMVVAGVGFLIFFHELGHFLAAKWAGVRVDAFSLGFGPKLFGWKRGDTEYMLCLLPIGGYVRMAGEEPDASRDDPGSLGAKSVPWRYLIFSGGVIMNVLFALIIFPLVFEAGVLFRAPKIGFVTPGGPAWKAGLRPGSEMLEIQGKQAYSFDQLQMESALSGDAGVRILTRTPDGKEKLVIAHPVMNENRGLKLLGVYPAAKPGARVEITQPDGPAAKAGLENEDRIMTLAGKPLTPRSFEEWERERIVDPDAFRAKYAKVPVEVERGDKTLTVQLQPEWKLDEEHPRVGVFWFGTRVAAFRGDNPAVKRLGLRVGDVLLEVRHGSESTLLERPEQLRKLLATPSADTKLLVQRVKDGKLGPVEAIPVPEALTGPGVAALLDSTAFELDDVTGRVRVQKGQAAWKAGLRDGDRIVEFDGEKYDSLEQFRDQVREVDGRASTIAWQPRDGEGVRRAKIQPTPQYVMNLGFDPIVEEQQKLFRTEGLVSSLKAGCVHSINLLKQLYVTLKRMFGGSVSARNLGGIVTISVVSYRTAKAGWPRFLYFLAILSLNLAFINVLPIPVLDGGHMLFLTIEAIKGSPVSERVLGYSQMLGLVIVLALLIFVTFNDIVRLFH